MEPLDEDAADEKLMIGQRALEKAFQQVLEQFKQQSRNAQESRPVGRRNYESSENCEKLVSSAVSRCCCGPRCHFAVEKPKFSFDFTNNASCNVDYAKTAGLERILQIHLPESSKDPCQILITSNRDQVTVKYLKQGQHFTFTSSNSSDDTGETSSRKNINESTRTKCASISSSIGRDIEETSPKENGNDFLNGDTPENLRDNSFLSLSDNNADLPADKKHKKQSLNTFIDSLLTKRTMEEGRKRLDSTTMSSDSETDHARPLEIQVEDAINASKEATSFISENTREHTNKIFQSEAERTAEMPQASHQLVKSPSYAKQISLVNTSIKKGRFRCQYCSQLFEQRSQCLVHISQSHGEDRPHHCLLCDATFKKRRSLLYHVRHHNGERPYKCTYCDKAFKEKYHLTVHIRTHTGERPFACNQCGKAFKQTNELTSHIRTHTGEKPYKCNLCDKWFKRRTQLYNHNLSHISRNTEDLQESNVEMASTDVVNSGLEKPLEVLPLDNSTIQ